jgi:hypothetical protein
MADSASDDLHSLDRDIALAVARLARWRGALSKDPEAHAGDDPLEAVRHVASKSLWEALGRLPIDGTDAALIAGLKRWVYALLQARLARADDLAWARLASAPQGLIDERRVSWREAWREVVLARTPGRARQALEAAAEAGPSLAPIVVRSADRRAEIARRLKLTHPWEPIVGLPPRDVTATAARFLDATDDIARSLRDEHGDLGANAAGLLHSAVARGAGHGWPSRLTHRWLHETFGFGTVGLTLELPALPEAIGAASFARALSMFGFAFRLATMSRSMPFSMAREPGFVGAHRLAFVFGGLVGDADFYVRMLGVGQRIALAQARLLTGTALMDARLHAARVLLGDDVAPAPRELFEEVTTRLFGAPLDPRLRGAWPRARDDEPARWVALLEADPLRHSLRQRFDVDWFRNPRAWSDLRAQGAAISREPVDASIVGGNGVDELARAFERALG